MGIECKPAYLRANWIWARWRAHIHIHLSALGHTKRGHSRWESEAVHLVWMLLSLVSGEGTRSSAVKQTQVCSLVDTVLWEGGRKSWQSPKQTKKKPLKGSLCQDGDQTVWTENPSMWGDYKDVVEFLQATSEAHRQPAFEGMLANRVSQISSHYCQRCLQLKSHLLQPNLLTAGCRERHRQDYGITVDKSDN